MAKVPDEYLAEATAYNDECEANYDMTQYYDCQCLSYEYLKERVKEGKYVDKSEITLAIARKCRDASLASGPVYVNCLKTANTMEPGTDPEKYCTCVANSYSKLMEREAPTISSRSMIRLKTQATVSCRNPALAKRLYPYNP